MVNSGMNNAHSFETFKIKHPVQRFTSTTKIQLQTVNTPQTKEGRKYLTRSLLTHGRITEVKVTKRAQSGRRDAPFLKHSQTGMKPNGE